MKHLVVILVSILVFALWLLPLQAQDMFPNQQWWGLMYIPISGVTAGWGGTLYHRYFNSY